MPDYERLWKRGDEVIASGATVHWPTLKPGRHNVQPTVEVSCTCKDRRCRPLDSTFRNSGLCRPCAVATVRGGRYLAFMEHRWFDKEEVL